MPRLLLSLSLCLAALLGLVALAVIALPVAAQPVADSKAPASPKAPTPPKDPYTAYEGGFYDRALSGFLDRQMSRPEAPDLSLAVGSAHYQMKSYDEAAAAYDSAAQQGDPKLREQALYNLGNVAFRQGRLEDAVKLYQGALELDPDDQDAKHNLEFVRDEIRRRLEEAKKRQEQQEQQQPGQQGQEPQEPQPPNDQPQQGEGEQQGQQPQPSPEEKAGEEDKASAEGETPKPEPGEEEQAAAAEARPGSLTPEQAAELLASLSEGEPKKRQRGRPGKARGGKDW